MKKITILITYISTFFLIMGCSSKVTEEYLIERQWTLQVGYDNDKRGEKPSCIPLQDGLEFKDDGLVYVELFDRDFEYRISEKGFYDIIS